MVTWLWYTAVLLKKNHSIYFQNAIQSVMNYKVGNGSSQSFLNCHSQLWNNYTSLPAFSFPLLGLPEQPKFPSSMLHSSFCLHDSSILPQRKRGDCRFCLEHWFIAGTKPGLDPQTKSTCTEWLTASQSDSKQRRVWAGERPSQASNAPV